jgi:hypothetical protein
VRVFLGAALALVACGAATTPLVGPEGDEPSCKDAVAASSGADGGCVAAAALVTCSAGEVCISDDPTSCHGASAHCRDECSGDEYAIACDVHGHPMAAPPPGCLAMAVAANGTQYFCCPCTP